VHLVGFITKKFITMHGHMNVKFHSVLYPIKLMNWKVAVKSKTSEICACASVTLRRVISLELI